MPDSKDRAKMTGDTHPPELEPELPFEDGSSDEPGSAGTPRDRGPAAEGGEAGRQQDRDAPTSNSDHTTRQSGERSGPGQR